MKLDRGLVIAFVLYIISLVIIIAFAFFMRIAI